jgi:hypothetical protein
MDVDKDKKGSKWDQNFYVPNVLIFALSQSVFETRLEKLDRDKHSSIFRNNTDKKV